ncbi:MAG: hypothetical protein HY711_03520 [Candidatus Melainabacteria bacterium]|nr:hypothetical protein [Candidatus Melainabacteria bacterium]
MNPRVVVCILACGIVLGCMPYVLAARRELSHIGVAQEPRTVEYVAWSVRSDSDPVFLAKLGNVKPLPLGVSSHWTDRLKAGAMYEQLGFMNLACQEYEQAANLVGHKGPATVLPWQNMVRFKLRLNDMPAAQKWADLGRERFPCESQLWEVSIRLWMGQLAMGKAQQLADKAIVLFPSKPAFLALKILTLMTQKDTTKVDSCLRHALTLFPHSAEIHNAHGLVLLSRNKAKEALEEFNTSIEIDQKCYQAYLLKARALGELGHTVQVSQCYKDMFYKLPLDLTFTMTYLEDLMKHRKFKDAFEPALVFLVGCGNDPYRTSSLYGAEFKQRISLIVKVGLISIPAAKADKLIDQAAHHFVGVDRQAQVHLQAGAMYDLLGYCHQASKQYRKALLLQPASSKTHLLLAQYLENQLLDYEGALAEYRQVVSVEGQSVDLDNHIERLSRRLDNQPNDVAWKLKDFVRLFVGRNSVVGAVRLMISN